jgi:hypothetical protein
LGAIKNEQINMKAILKEEIKDFPFDWANLNSYRESSSYRKEIYLKDHNSMIEGLIFLFYSLFGHAKNRFIIYNKSWWDFCLDSWDFNKDEYNYDLESKSAETQEYLKILKESEIQVNYSGCCICMDWDRFLFVVLKCIISHKAPYSPLFCDVEEEYFFYFHHTGSIGIYYKNENDAIKEILAKSYKGYTVED